MSEDTVSINDVSVALPDGAIAYRYGDDDEPARWIYSEEDAHAIEDEDPELIEWPDGDDEDEGEDEDEGDEEEPDDD